MVSLWKQSGSFIADFACPFFWLLSRPALLFENLGSQNSPSDAAKVSIGPVKMWKVA
jgi:hypothetical protein